MLNFSLGLGCNPQTFYPRSPNLLFSKKRSRHFIRLLFRKVSRKKKKNNIPFQQLRLQLTLYCTGKVNKLAGLHTKSPAHKKKYFFQPIPKIRSTERTLLRRLRLNCRSMIMFLKRNCSWFVNCLGCRSLSSAKLTN